MLMNVRRFTVASLPLLALLLLAGSALTANAGALDYCKADAARLCPGIEGPPVLKCLKEHAMEVSIGCGKAVKKMKAQMGK
jgi:hypothetical protein